MADAGTTGTAGIGGAVRGHGWGPSGDPAADRLVAGLQGGSGSAIGPDGALYVTENAAGRVTRVDPRTGATTTYASGLPKLIPAAGFGGPVDLAFVGRTAYVLVTLVGPDVGGSDVVGIYRVDGPDRFTVVADIGAFSINHPPGTDFFVPSGVQYALQADRGGLLVSDGHHNRVLGVSRHGQISVLGAFANIVPAGLEVGGGTIYLAQAGPVPHRPEDGKVVALRPGSPTVRELASGSPLLVDVEFGPRHRLYALSQGVGSGGPEGSPALANTGALVKAGRDGTFSVVAEGLNQPTSLEFIKDTAYLVTLGGEIWKINGA
jgi:hypothetical protein